MAVTIDQAFVNTFKRGFELKFQQMGSRLRSTVTEDKLGAEYGYFDRIDDVSAFEKTGRNSQVQYDDPQHSRRRVSMRTFYWSTLVDTDDKLALLQDPASDYNRSGTMALGRQVDQLILDSATGTAYSGKAGSTSVAFSAAQVVAVNYVDSGTAVNSNLTVGKLREARRLLDSNEAVADGEALYIVYTSSQVQALLESTEVTSADYNNIKALVNGEVDTFMGFKFIRTELTNTDTNSYRRVLAYPKSAIKVSFGKDITAKLDRIPERHYATQVYTSVVADSVRMWEEKIVEIKCDES
jgi:hypothetical protein